METVTHTPFWRQKTFWAAVLAIAAALPSLVDQVAAVLPPDVKARATAVAATAAALAALFARSGGVKAARDVEQSIELVDTGESLKEALAADRAEER